MAQGEGFRWLSAHGIGVILFLVMGLIWILIGAAAPVVNRLAPPDYPDWFVMSPRADGEYLGQTPSLLFRDVPAFRLAYRAIIVLMAGVIVSLGFLQVMVCWFALRQGAPWALWAVTGQMAVLLIPAFWLVWTGTSASR